MAKGNGPKPNPRVIVRGKVLRLSAGVQEKYLHSLITPLERMQEETRKLFTRLFKQDFAAEHFAFDSVGMDAANISSQARILTNSLKKKYDQLFGSIATPVSNKMADAVNRNSFVTSKAAVIDLKGESQKLTLDMRSLDKETLSILRASAARSASFIQSIPERYLNSVADHVYNSIATGNGLQDLLPFLDKHDKGTKNWVNNTAMDQTRKAYNGLNKGRMTRIGITEGEWIHSGGSQHPRELHEEFDGKVFNIAEGAPVGDDGGNMVDPGEEPNCRCTFAPVITDKDDTPEEGDGEDDE
jgi:ABC-type proline/glycine betaine transport system substrate-binding protein